MAAATDWHIAKYSKCGGTLAYFSNLGNKNKARVLKTATHLGLYMSKQHSLLSSTPIINTVSEPKSTVSISPMKESVSISSIRNAYDSLVMIVEAFDKFTRSVNSPRLNSNL